MNKNSLKRAYDKANSTVQVVEQEAEQIVMKEIAEVEDRPLDTALAHALFLNGRIDEDGDLMNKLALINTETMKMAAKKKGLVFYFQLGKSRQEKSRVFFI